jgi:glycosyltransferase involved in cell wall biosynthesis
MTNRRLLMIVRDPFPTSRPDLVTLFGKYLIRLGIGSDVVAQVAGDSDTAQVEWPAGRLILCGKRRSRMMGQLSTLWNDVKALTMLWGSRYDALQVRDKIFTGVLGLIAARIAGKPMYYWMSYPIPESDLERARVQGAALGLVRWTFTYLRGVSSMVLLYKWLLRKADHVFVQSERMAEVLAERGIARDRMTPVPMGVDLEIARADAVEPAHDDRIQNRRLVVYLGALERPRRADFLFEVLALVRKKVPDAVLVLVGDAGEAFDRAWLKERAVELDVDSAVVWTGWLPSREAWRFLRAADVGLSPIPPGPLYDVSSPTKTIEYLAFGLPVVANAIPDQATVIAESGAGICVPYAAPSFADAIVRLLKDPALRAEMGRRGQASVGHARSYQTIAGSLGRTYATLIPRDGEQKGSDRLDRCW